MICQFYWYLSPKSWLKLIYKYKLKYSKAFQSNKTFLPKKHNFNPVNQVM